MSSLPDLRLLSYFLAVADELHYGRAAERLMISQPALSTQIQNLERALGVKLFERTTRRVSLTPAGEVLVFEAEELLGQAERTIKTVRVAGRGRIPFVVGYQMNAAAELTPTIVSRFRAAAPHLDVQLRPFDLTDPYAGLCEAHSDVAFVRPPFVPFDWLGMATLFVEPRVIALPETSPMAAKPMLTFDDVVDLPFVMRKAPEQWRDFCLARDERGSADVRIGAEVETVDECLDAITSGAAVSFTQSSTQRYFDIPGLVYRPFQGVSPSTVAVGWRHDNHSEDVATFVALATAAAREFVLAFSLATTTRTPVPPVASPVTAP